MSLSKSKPVYVPLRADLTGHYHLMIAHAEGGSALRPVIDELRAHAHGGLGRTRILIAGSSTEPLFGAGVSALQVFGATADLLAECRSLLERSLMGTRLYVAGPEQFIGRVLQIALEFNLNQDEIQAEALGTRARRVHCIHCRATTESITTNIAQCAGCSRWLLVRDHYSRRFAAYMGVMVDAEAPGERPPIEEIFG